MACEPRLAVARSQPYLTYPLAPPRKSAGLFSFCRCYAWRMPQDDRRPEPQWRLLVIVLCWGVVLAALGLLLRWWGF